MTAYFQK